MSRRPRILYLTPCWPHDRVFGGQLRSLYIGRALQQFGDVTLSVISSDVPEEEVRRKTAEEFQVEPAPRVETQPNRGLSRKLQWAFNPRFANVHGCGLESSDRARLLGRLKDFDLVWLMNSRTPNIIQQWHWPKSVLDIDDVPSTYQRSVSQNASSVKERFQANIQMRLFRRREQLWDERFSTLCVCSETDRKYVGADHMHVIPNGFKRPATEPVPQPANPPRIGFIGLYSFQPNLDGVRWFLKECWPRIRQEVPGVRFRLVGKDTDGPLKPDAPDVDVLGWMADPAAEFATWSTTIIPIRFGAGTRIKLADAFSRKCPVVSTRLGAFGYEVQSGRELVLADDPAEFAAACISLIRDPAKARTMADTAYKTFLEKWTWDAVAPRVWAAAEDTLRRS